MFQYPLMPMYCQYIVLHIAPQPLFIAIVSAILCPTLPSAGRSSEQNKGTYADALLASMKRWAFSFTNLTIRSWYSVLELHTPRLCITFP